MEIEFNASRVPKSGYSEPLKRQVASPQPSSTEVVHTADTLQSKLKEPLVRPDTVAQAQNQVSDEKYPPNDVLDRIAVLLAIRMKQ